ncbi:glycosyl transferase family 2 [Pseudopedobacter saltans DSM 12145]|uniref:Glycosyl transferase family 2 n=1 Tax=Pseudopedobacter saltans (strain ATCC 51119 / DSM 12145 / JCM 21818 / CCUG 39354 / LMG 10337 / NBRC 100064 / NCIMB 13643) TaxID=762903 RepID=F0SD64_PSESL|nr:glycosyltransferase family 2 protein [Pseudopedobacter saltans]ADY52850.1 glycosyl transferase family 2 [Pseudopedobacter saltans DSM 12145]
MLISIITSTYNSASFLADALESFKEQSYAEKELVLVDGGSTDETLQIIEKSAIVGKMISEQDGGIYDALNKGVKLASGDIIGILHSDDMFYNAEVLNNVAEAFKANPHLDAVYGDLLYVERDNTDKVVRNWKSGSYDLAKLAYGWMPPHPALFIKTECFHKYGLYDLQYRSAADYDLILRFLYKYKIETAYLPQVLVKMRVGGISNKTLKNRIRANAEDRAAMKVNGVAFPFLVAALKPLRKIGQYIK